MISTRAKGITPSLTMGISQKVSELKSQGKDVLSLSIGEPDFLLPESAKKGIEYALENHHTKYDLASGNFELKKTIVQKFKEDFEVEIDTSEIVISSGAKHAIFNVMMATLNPDDEVLLPTPYWVTYPETIKLVGAKPIIVKADRNKNFAITKEDLLPYVSAKTKMLLLNNPSNPSGYVYTKEELRDLLEFCYDHQILVLADEIYEAITYEEPFTSVLSVDPKYRDLICIINGFSKSASMTGLRVGYSVTTKEIAKAIGSIQGHLVSHPATTSQDAALFAQKYGQEEREFMRSTYEKRRNMIVEFLKDTPLTCIKPKGAFYLFIDLSALKPYFTGDSLSMEFCKRLLDEQGVALVPGLGFGEDDFVRLSYAASEEVIKDALKRIKTFIEGL